MSAWEHKPGSPEAVTRGCLCPILDNHGGAGVTWGGETSWWIDGDCPLHAGTLPASQAVSFKEREE